MKYFEQKISDNKYKNSEEFQRSSKIFTLSHVPNKGEMAVLDVGCGTGVNSTHIAELGHHVFGIDISAIAVKKYNHRGLTGCICDIGKGLPFRDKSFDFIFASEV